MYLLKDSPAPRSKPGNVLRASAGSTPPESLTTPLTPLLPRATPNKSPMLAMKMLMPMALNLLLLVEPPDCSPTSARLTPTSPPS
jgi:hypothetical protein